MSKAEPWLPITAIFDIDGTLALNKSGREWFAYKQVNKDDINEPIADILALLHATGYTIMLLTSREEWSKKHTIAWLEENDIPFDKLFMKATNDRRKDAIIKQEIYLKDIMPYYDVSFVFEDKDQVVKMWRNLGITCLQVAKGTF
jgi:uncharacterized HAD superfamily protein|tara:strand:- start:2092 stop:2526 length:435 start_codon:yes stop_codon:yes gene_type:complete